MPILSGESPGVVTSPAQLGHSRATDLEAASVTALTLRVDTPCTYISARVPTKAYSERW